jgi:hypothetical protein
MIDEARARRRHLDGHLAEIDGGPSPHPERIVPARKAAAKGAVG